MKNRGKRSLGVVGNTPNQPIGVGYIIVPEDKDRDKYVKDCYRSNLVIFRDMEGDVHTRVPISKTTLREINFPQTSDGLGSLIVYVTVPKENTRVIIGTVDYNKIISDVVKENQHKIVKTHTEDGKTKSASIDLDAQGGAIHLVLKALASRMNIFALSADNDAEMRDFVQGLREIFGTNQVTLKSNSIVEFIVEDADTTKKFECRYITGQGWTVEDEYGNLMEWVNGEIKFNGGNNGGLINIEGLVSNMNTVENLLNTLVNLYIAHTHVGNIGAPTPILPVSIQGLSNVTPTNRTDFEDDKVTH